MTTAVLSTAGCAAATTQDAARPSMASASDVTSVATGSAPSAEASSYDLCAELPPYPPNGLSIEVDGTSYGGLESWWNATPANADGSIMRDPARWREPRMREHPRVAEIRVADDVVMSTYDRVACGQDPTYQPTRTAEWPAAGEADLVVVDMDTAEVLFIWSAPR